MEDSLKLHYFNKKKVVVLDVGSRYTKLGFSGGNNPRYIVPTELFDVTTKFNSRVLDSLDKNKLYDNLAEFFHYLYSKFLLVNPKDTKVVLVENILGTTLCRDIIAKVLFQHLQVSSILFVPSHMVALYTLAVPSALSIDLGYAETSVVPVFEGYPVLHAYQAAPIGGRAIESEIRCLLKAYYEANDPSKVSIVEALPDNVIEEIKVTLLFVAPFEKVGRKDKNISRPPDVMFPISGQPHLLIPGSLREDACEVLFRPDIDGVCLPTMVLDAILKCPVDMRKIMAERLLLFGGSASLPGLRKRLSAEIMDVMKSDSYKNRLFVQSVKMFKPPAQDNYTSWLGGAILGATDTVNFRAITKEEYEKQGDVPDWANLKYNIRNPDVCRKNVSDFYRKQVKILFKSRRLSLPKN